MDIKMTKPDFEITDRNYKVRAWGNYKEDSRDALIEIQKDGEAYKEFEYPSYKIWNIAAHFRDIVDSEIAENDRGYRIAGSTGFGGVIMPNNLNIKE
jgi:hypothetical protein